jgi:hypothetical protein
MVRELVVATAALLVLGSSADAGKVREFKVGDWIGAAFTEDSGEFSHCAAYTHGHGGPGILFGINRDFLWSLGIVHLSWRMTVDATYDVSLTIDGHTPIFVKGVAVADNNLEIDLEDKAALFSLIRGGRQLTVIAADQVFTLKLYDSSQILPNLVDCVRSGLNRMQAPFVPPRGLPPARR